MYLWLPHTCLTLPHAHGKSQSRLAGMCLTVLLTSSNIVLHLAQAKFVCNISDVLVRLETAPRGQQASRAWHKPVSEGSEMVLSALQDAEQGLKAALSSASSKDKEVKQMETQLQQHRCNIRYSI